MTELPLASRWSAESWPDCRREHEAAATALAAKRMQDSRVHFKAYLPSLMCCSAVPLWL